MRAIRLALASCVVLVAAASVTVSAGVASKKAATPTTVTVAIGPYYDYQLIQVAKTLGLDRQLGLNIKLESFPGVPLRQLQTGAIDVAYSCDSCFLATIKNFPTYRDIIATNQFKGFVLVGRKGKVVAYSTYVARAHGNLVAAKRSFIREQVKGKTFAICNATDLSTVQGLLSQGGLTTKDIKIINFADDGKSADAFVAGTGDFYTGSLPQEARLLYSAEFKGQYVTAAPQQAFGPGTQGGVLYSTFAATQTWLNTHASVAAKLAAVWYRAVNYLNKKPSVVLPMIATAVKESTGGVLPQDVTKAAMLSLNYFPTFNSARTYVFGTGSATNFLTAARYQGAQAIAAKQIPAGTDLAPFQAEGQVYRQVSSDPALVKFINAPIK